jgi:hypothetical protein
MTIKEITNHLMELSKDHIFNGVEANASWLENFIRTMFKSPLKNHNKLIMYANNFGDGGWYFTITKYGNKSDEFDYYIPDTREQEKKIIDLLN